MLQTDIQAGIATVTLDRPHQYNALSIAMLDALQAQLSALSQREEVRVVILAAHGKAFCAGHDLKEMRESEDPEFHRQLFARCSQLMLTINQLAQPVIARVSGIATAAGCQLVAACDLAVAEERARFAVSGINLGLFCATPAVALSRNLSRKRALQMLLTGEFIDAATALEWGLVNSVVPAEQLDTEVQRFATLLAAKSPLAVRLGKQLFYRQLEVDLEQAYALAGETMVCNLASYDAKEGIDAFIEKRPPNWRGC